VDVRADIDVSKVQPSADIETRIHVRALPESGHDRRHVRLLQTACCRSKIRSEKSTNVLTAGRKMRVRATVLFAVLVLGCLMQVPARADDKPLKILLRTAM
jgi:hypothetical protein